MQNSNKLKEYSHHQQFESIVQNRKKAIPTHSLLACSMCYKSRIRKILHWTEGHCHIVASSGTARQKRLKQIKIIIYTSENKLVRKMPDKKVICILKPISSVDYNLPYARMQEYVTIQ